MSLPALKPFVKLFTLCLGSFFTLAAAAQVKQHPLLNFAHTTTTSAATAAARSASFAPATDGQPCTTSTFFMHIPTLPGQKISISAVKVTPAGDYIIAGNLVTVDGTSSVGMLMRLDNAGNILAQQAVNAGNINTLVLAMDVLPDGSIVIAGSIKNGPFNSFVAYFDASFNGKWLHNYNAKQAVSKMSAYVTNDGRFAIAMQLPDAVTCLMLKNTGAQSWNTIVTPAGFTGLISFMDMPDGNMALLTNGIQGGKNVTRLTELQSTNGTEAASVIMGTDEVSSLTAVNFNGRLSSFGVIKNGGAYSLVRNISYSYQKIETHQTYQLGLPVDFSVSAGMDNAGDIMALCLPGKEKMVLIKHFDYYQTSVEYTKAYSIPKAAGMGGAARSYDGGYLFGVNTKDSLEIVLIKTDSIGLLGGCTKPVAVTNTMAESYQVDNTPVTGNVLGAGVFGVVASAYKNAITLTPYFDCRQNYCPEPPAEDTCLPTYYKTYRSHSYVDGFGLSYHLMRGNNQLLRTNRYDRVFGNGNAVSSGVKLFDEKGNFKKGAVIVNNDGSTIITTKQVDDRNVLLLSYAVVSGAPVYTFSLMSDNLDITWNKSIQLPQLNGQTFYPYATDVLEDQEGNFYFVATHPGFFSPSLGFVYKMDASGNALWIKGYSFTGKAFSAVNAVATKAGIVLMMNSEDGTGGSMLVNKQNGDILNACTYKHKYHGLLEGCSVYYNSNHILYEGTGDDGHPVIGVFNDEGRPLKLSSIPALPALRSVGFSNAAIYGICEYYDGSKYSEIIFKADTALHVAASMQYPFEKYRESVGIVVSPSGNVYEAGNSFVENYDYGYIRKYDSQVKLGTCGAPFNLTKTDLDANYQVVSFTTLPTTVNPAKVTISVIPDNDGPAVDNILCSSTNTCNSIKISGPPAVCQVNTEYSYSIKKNAGCTTTPVWVYDTAFAAITKFTDTSASVFFKKTGTVQLKALLDGGCKIYGDSMVVTVQKQPAAFTLGRDTALCPNDTLLLKAGTGFSTYKWQDGSADSSYHVKQPGKYYVQVSNACNEQFGDTIVISGLTVPMLSIGNDTAICLNDTLHLQATAGFASYTWPAQVAAAGRNAAYIAKQDETINVKATTKDGCPAADTLNITVNQPRPINLGRDTSFCSGDSLIIDAGNGYINYQWSDGSTTQQTVARTAGSYRVKAQDVNKCYATDTMQVLAVYPLPAVSLGSPAPLCAGSKRVLDAGSFTSYLWQDGSIQRYFTADTTGAYTVQVKDNNGCTGSGQTAVLEVIPLPANFLKSTDSLCQYDKLTLAPVGDFSTYTWSNGVTLPNITVDMPGSYILAVTNSAGCAGSDTITVVQKQCMLGFYVPNAFTPNGDGHNDVFRPSLFGNVQSYLFCIYNRFGELVFKTNKPGEGWDGNYKGKPFDSGTTFVWRCQYQLQGDKPVSAKGTLVLIK